MLLYYIKFYLRVENVLALFNAVLLGAIGGSFLFIAPVSSLMNRFGKKELLCNRRSARTQDASSVARHLNVSGGGGTTTRRALRDGLAGPPPPQATRAF